MPSVHSAENAIGWMFQFRRMLHAWAILSEGGGPNRTWLPKMWMRRGREMAFEGMPTEKRRQILDIAARYGARNVRIFGSVARGQADERSDIDFLVEMEAGRSLFDLGGLQADLEAALGRPVDVVTEKGLKARIRSRVLREAIPV
jgi:hypothetical protein